MKNASSKTVFLSFVSSIFIIAFTLFFSIFASNFSPFASINSDEIYLGESVQITIDPEDTYYEAQVTTQFYSTPLFGLMFTPNHTGEHIINLDLYFNDSISNSQEFIFEVLKVEKIDNENLNEVNDSSSTFNSDYNDISNNVSINISNMSFENHTYNNTNISSNISNNSNNIDLGVNLNMSMEDGISNHTLESELVINSTTDINESYFENITIIDTNISKNITTNVSNTTNQNFTTENISLINATQNDTNISLNLENVSSEFLLNITENISQNLTNETLSQNGMNEFVTTKLIQGVARVGEPVVWRLEVEVNNSNGSNKVITIPIPSNSIIEINSNELSVVRNSNLFTSIEEFSQNSQMEIVKKELEYLNRLDRENSINSNQRELKKVLEDEFDTRILNQRRDSEFKTLSQPQITQSSLDNFGEEYRVNISDEIFKSLDTDLIVTIFSNSTEVIITNLITSSPKLEESFGVVRQGEVFAKEITVSSDASIHYYNVEASTLVPSTRANDISLLWENEQGNLVDVTQDSNFNVEFLDLNGDGLINMITWIVPKLSQQNFRVVVEESEFNSVSQTLDGMWRVLLENVETTSDLRIQTITSNQISFESLELWNDDLGDWELKSDIILPTAANNYTLRTQHLQDDSNLLRVNYQILEFDEFSLKINFNEQEHYIYSHNKYEQLTNVLNLNNPIIRYQLCSFSTQLFVCGANIGEPGFEGIILNTQDSNSIILEIPKNSTIISSSLEISHPFETPLVIIDKVSINFEPKITAGSFVSGFLKNQLVSSSRFNIKLYDQISLEWNFANPNRINYITTMDINPITDEDEIIVATNGRIFSLNSLGNLTNEFVDLSRNFLTIGNKLGNFELDITAPNSSQGVTRYRVDELVYENPYDFTSQNSCIVRAGFNYQGDKSGDLVLTLNNNSYNFQTELITRQSELEFRNFERIDNIFCLGCENNSEVEFDLGSLGIPNSVENFEVCSISNNFLFSGDNISSIELYYELDGIQYYINRSEITSEYTELRTSSFDEDLVSNFIPIDSSTSYNHSYSYSVLDSVNNLCFIESNLQFVGNNDNNLFLNLGQETYLVETSQVSSQNELFFKNFENIVAQNSSCIGCNNSSNLSFDLSYLELPSEISALTCEINFGLNFRGSNDNNLTFYLNETQYSINNSQILTEELL
ncbi:MAG: hypothetical protein LAT82_02895 [Nanoarchaeota archaeon]|nr:hypothetical protein [Nanoarchaeota archaeon]